MYKSMYNEIEPVILRLFSDCQSVCLFLLNSLKDYKTYFIQVLIMVSYEQSACCRLAGLRSGVEV